VDDPRVINADSRLSFIREFINEGELLEVGCGDGVSLLRASEKLDFYVTGIDSSLSYQDNYSILCEQNIKVYSKNISDMKFEKSFDVICSYLVLEHIQKPVEFLTELTKHLHKKGVIVIEIPDLSLYSKSSSENMLTHEHIYHFSLESFSLFAESAGLQIVGHKTNVSYGFSMIIALKFGPVSKKETLKPQQLAQDKAHFQVYLDNIKRYNQTLKYVLKSVLNDSDEAIACFGVGEYFYRILNVYKSFLTHISLLIDDTPEKLGTVIQGNKIHSSSALRNFPGRVIIAIPSFEPLIAHKISKLNPNIEIVLLNELVELKDKLDETG
jgi:2-polyprenyl-3-methyl-5-hydroxy-6-metoxy-1,4-benzoquinol methylase